MRGFFASNKEALLRLPEFSGDAFSLMSLVASSTAKVNWHLYRKSQQDGRRRYTTAQQGDDQRVEVTRHAALDLWAMPNPFFTQRAFIEGQQQHLELTGEGYWVFMTAGAVHLPINMFYVRPDRMEPVPDPEKFLAGYVYTAPNGEKIPLQPYECLGPPSLAFPNPWDIYRGLSPAQSVLADVRNSQYATQWNNNWFRNNAEPGGVITVPNRWDDPEFDEFTDRWRETHKGISAAGMVAVVEGGATWTPNAISHRDMQFVELRVQSWQNTRRAWRIHPQMTGDVDDVNRANAETAEETFTRWITCDRLDRIRDVLNGPYLRLFGAADQVEFDYTDPVPDNREADNEELTARANAAAVLAQAGWDMDDVLETVGLPAMRVAGAPPPSVSGGASTTSESSGGLPAEADQEIQMARLAESFRQIANQELADLGRTFAELDGAVR
jgi:HK97 family phage portal protein